MACTYSLITLYMHANIYLYIYVHTVPRVTYTEMIIAYILHQLTTEDPTLRSRQIQAVLLGHMIITGVSSLTSSRSSPLPGVFSRLFWRVRRI